MAEWDKRDPRWIVQEREDGHNCNDWHWNEKNLLPWSRQRIDELVKGISADLDTSIGSATITGVKEITGEAYLTVRKQNKKFQVYDLNIVLTWEGRWAEDGTKVEGDVRVNEWSSIDPEEYLYEVTVSPKDSGSEAAANLKLAVQGLQTTVFARLQQYVEDLKQL